MEEVEMLADVVAMLQVSVTFQLWAIVDVNVTGTAERTGARLRHHACPQGPTWWSGVLLL